MRALALMAAAAALILGGVWSATAVGSSTDGRGAFTDDDGSVHESDINGLARSGITRGCDPPANTRYCPDSPITRAQMATFLVRGLELPPTDSSPFSDTDATEHRGDIDRLAAAGITLGCNPPANTRYCPQDPVTRAQMASFLVRALELPPGTAVFKDTAGSVHHDDIDALASADITKGCDPPANTRYCPEDPVTRAQMASFLVRALDDVDPELNGLSLRNGITCNKAGTACSKRVTLAEGTRLEIEEGWYQVLPYRSGEEQAFKASGTNVGFTWTGSNVTGTYLGVSETDQRATREWRSQPPALTPGTHVVRGVWRWNGSLTQTVTVTVAVP